MVRNRCFGLMCSFFQAEDGIRDLVRSRGLGDVYKRQVLLEGGCLRAADLHRLRAPGGEGARVCPGQVVGNLSLIHI